MKTVFFLLILISTPNQPTIKYNGILYKSEAECIIARDGYMKNFNNQTQEYKGKIMTDVHCIPFDAFPLIKAGVGA